MSDKNFVSFSKPFIDALKDTFEMMVQTTLKAHSPKIKEGSVAKGDITAMIGMNGTVEKEGKEKEFKGLLAISWPEELYVKLASRMLFEEYTEYCDDISDSGAEICNIIMGNAKNGLSPLGYKIEMASPSTIRGKQHEIRYPPKTTVIEIIISCDLGDFTLELCYQEHA
ncbi:MAG: chemotaxis protein CheX [Halobacteriovoraceae bacterium]|jgi:chemotaxis protein CheX|nr:chemotaxis protein CheX [Halobacteriovoraceae bacterium]